MIITLDGTRPITKSYIVVCGKYAEFEDFCKFRVEDYYDKKVTRFEGCEFTYCSTTDSARGRKFDDIIQYGTYYTRDDLDVQVILRSVKRKYSSWGELIQSEYYERFE